MRILLVEDEAKVASFIKKGLEEEFYTVDCAEDGKRGLLLAEVNDYDLIILDVMLPGIDGMEVCRRLRQHDNRKPILMLTAVDSLSKKVEGLETGADDYLTKPFAYTELLARIRALLRRSQDGTSELFVDDLKMDVLARRVFRTGREIVLTPKEFAMLEYFMRNRGRVLSRTQIIENVWGYTFDPLTNVVDVHVKALREKIGDTSGSRVIHTVRGAGYVLKGEDDR